MNNPMYESLIRFNLYYMKFKYESKKNTVIKLSSEKVIRNISKSFHFAN